MRVTINLSPFLQKCRPVDIDRAACYFNYGSNMCRLGASGAGRGSARRDRAGVRCGYLTHGLGY
ncbi:hypothetical protein BOSE127_140068 [Bosea sp. 127]|nr:hypothetical protein BOSE127_140068 [Bosea sp. 127]